jgi:hypothetical protein
MSDDRGTKPEFSPRNPQHMGTFAGASPGKAIAQQLAAQLLWGHLMRLLDTVLDPAERDWYAGKAVEHGWSRAMPAHHLAAKLYMRRLVLATGGKRGAPTTPRPLGLQPVAACPWNVHNGGKPLPSRIG